MNTIFESLQQFLQYTGFANMTFQHVVMIFIGIVFIYLAIKKDWEPLLLIPIGFGMISETFLSFRASTSVFMRKDQ